MPSGIVYLDVDDEITSAATRIRDSPERRVALVLPYGSRVATSRINFRLLSRDAMLNEKQLAVVATDSATRALAASAGLPVFASVGEYESSVAGSGDDRGGPPASGAAPETAPTAVPGAVPETVSETVSAPGAILPEPASGTTSSGPTAATGKRSRRGQAAKAGLEATIVAAGDQTKAVALPQAAAPAEDAARPPRPQRPKAPAVGDETAQVAIPWTPQPATERTWRDGAGATAPPVVDQRSQRRPGSGSASRLPIIIVLAALGLVLLVGGVAAYVVLPSVSIVVTPRAEDLIPLDIIVTADPNASEPDAATRVVPADLVPLEVAVSDFFPATGKRVEEAAANGAVRFANLDFLRSNTIPAGSIVSTNAGVRFRTAKEVTVPRADLVGLTVFPGRITVNVTAVEPGTPGNVEPNTIVIVPQGKDPQALKVVNPDATSGGTHEEFPLVAQDDVDGALEQLGVALTTAFQTRLDDPSIAPPGATVFAETATLGDATPSVDPATLVGQEIETFEIGLRATGTVLTVDPAPVAAIADELLRAKVEAGHQLVAGSIQVEVSSPVVSEQTVAFSATATGQQVAVLDAQELRDLVIGKPLDEARETLSRFGDVELTPWPEWVGSVPTIVDRVDLSIGEGVPVETPAVSGSAS
jgi:hypothetical protein